MVEGIRLECGCWTSGKRDRYCKKHSGGGFVIEETSWANARDERNW